MKSTKNDQRKHNSKAVEHGFAGLMTLFLVLCSGLAAAAETQPLSPENTKLSKISTPPILEQAAPGSNANSERTTASDKTKDMATKVGSSNLQLRAAAAGITNLVMMMGPNGGKAISVRVPSCNYAGVLQELQNNNARFLLPGAEAPANAKAVFNLETEKTGLRQTVYFM